VGVRLLKAVTITRPTGKLLKERATVTVIRSLFGVVALLCSDCHTSVRHHCRFSSRGFKNRLVDNNCHHVLARTFLILEGRTGAVRRNAAFDVNCVGVLFRLIVGGIHDFDITVSEQGELKTLPLSPFLNRRIGIQQFENIGGG
jgi:hypothetical protein